MSTTPARPAAMSALKLALLAKQVRQQMEGADMLASEPIAIIGIGCRFPGGATSPDAFWELLARGGDAIGQVPPDRWDADAYYDADPYAPGTMNTRCPPRPIADVHLMSRAAPRLRPIHH